MNFGSGRFQRLESHKRIGGVALKDVSLFVVMLGRFYEAYKENKEKYLKAMSLILS